MSEYEDDPAKYSQEYWEYCAKLVEETEDRIAKLEDRREQLEYEISLLERIPYRLLQREDIITWDTLGSELADLKQELKKLRRNAKRRSV